MSFNSFEFSLLRAKRHADHVKQRQIVYDVRHKNDTERKKPQVSKIGLWLLFLDAFCIQIFCMWLIAKYASEMNIGTLIGSLVGLLGTVFVQAMSYGFYAKKSTAENTAGGIVFENMMHDFEVSNTNIVTDEPEGEDDAVG